MTETQPRGPSAAGSVVLDLGPGVGALVLHAPPELAGREIEISACGRDSRRAEGAQGKHRTHALVRPRLTAAGMHYAAVYPELAAGDYVVWGDAATPAMTVTVAGGRVTTAGL